MDELELLYETLIDLADFEEVGSVVRARLFITAANRWLITQPEEQEDQHNRIKFNTGRIEALLDWAHRYVATHGNGAAGSTRFLSVENFR